MTAVNANSPNIEFVGIRISIEQEGYRVTGRIEFPHPVCGKTSCPIDYAARRPDSSDDGPKSPYENVHHGQRHDLVKRWRRFSKDKQKA